VGQERIRLHGHEVVFHDEGRGDAIVLVHGLAGSAATWREAMPLLARTHRVIAPDLLGHGESAKPRGDYSLGAYASGIRDLLVAVGVEQATFVGHSLGGGIAMQLAYQFPERCERLVLVASGGLGRDVSPLLKAFSVPGAEYVLPVVLHPRLHGLLDGARNVVGRTGLGHGAVFDELWHSYSRLTDARAQRAFIHTIRSVIDVRGQRVSALDRLYLARKVPTLLMWGDRDVVIPVSHARSAHAAIPGSRLEVIEGAGHMLPIGHAARFSRVLLDFIDDTEPAHATEAEFRELLQGAATA
jgi:pimeloyl-ACP methyl ester carboxylesterase